MIASIYSFLMIIYGLCSIVYGLRMDTTMLAIGVSIFLLSCSCLYISTMNIARQNLRSILYFLTILCNDYIILAICGTLFGNWWWYISLSSSLVLILLWIMFFDHHTPKSSYVEPVVTRPRKTFLEIE